MTVVPSGAPAWVKSNSHTEYGGHINKRNHQGQDVVNARTDVGADQLARIAADMAAIQRVAPFAIVVYTNNDGAPAAPTVDEYMAMSGTAPTGARVSDGRVTFTWDASYLDEYGVSGDLHIIGAHASVNSAAAQAFCVVDISDPDANGKNERVEVFVFDDTGAAEADDQITLTVYTGTV